jgi:beta-lactamase regulating signal transducer with metallopeptidase domain
MSQLLVLYLGSLTFRSICIALVAGICSWKIRNVSVRHAVWVVVLGSILLMPAVDYLLPPTWVPARIQQIAAEQPVTFHIVSAGAAASPQPHAPATAAVALPAQSKPVDLWNIAATLYALVAFAMFIRLVLGYRKIRRLRRNGRTIASSVWEEVIALHRSRWRIPVLLESEAVHVPMTMGLVRTAILLPADWKAWDDWKMRAVLLHELAHVRRADWSISAIAALAKCAYWVNPLSWFLERKLSQLAEQASDDATLGDTQNSTRYAEILLEFAVAAQNGGRLMKVGVAMAQPNMKARIERVLGNPKSGTGIVKIAGWILVMMSAAPVIYSAAALQVTSEPVKPPVAAYAVEFGRNLSPQAPPANRLTVPESAQATVAKSQENSPTPAADPRVLSQQMEVVKEQLQSAFVELQAKLQAAQPGNQTNGGPAPEVPNTSDKVATADLLKEEMYRAQLRLQQSEAAVGQLRLQILNQPNPNQSQLDQLIVNEEALARYKTEIALLQQKIEEQRLASFSIEKADTNSKYRVYVTGRVQRPGDIPWEKPLTVLQALALAGGFQEYAKSDAISIIRTNGNSSTLFRFNYSEVIRGVNSSQNFYLENGDVVVVP